MRTLITISALALCATALGAAPAPAALPASVALPAPRTDGKVAVEKALKDRRSLRAPSPLALSLEDVSQLCWAAQGVTDDKGHRTAPSAMATYPLELYAMVGAVTGVAPGLYHYRPDKHDLQLVAAGDLRKDFVEKAIGQGWIVGAPVVFVVTGVAERVSKMKDRGAQFMWTEAGLAAENLFLQATALGEGSTFVGGYKPDAAKAFLKLPAQEEVLAVLPVGKRQ